MPAEAVVDTGTQTQTETFANFHANRGAAVPAAVEVKVEDPADTGTDEKTSADKEKPKEGEPESKVADVSETSPKQVSKVEKRKSEIQREIDELVRKRETLKREIETAKPSENGAPKTPAAAPAAYDGSDASDPEPKAPNDKDAKYTTGNGWEEYEKDRLRYAVELAKWEMRRDERVKSAKAAQEAQQKAHKEALDQFEARGTEFANDGDHADYPELVEKFKTRQISNEMAAVIVNADNGPAILYEVMKNPDEMKRIESLPTAIARLDAMYELKYKLTMGAEIDALKAKIEELENQAAPAQQKPKSAAPAVGTRLNGSGGGTSKEPSTFAGFRKQKFG